MSVAGELDNLQPGRFGILEDFIDESGYWLIISTLGGRRFWRARQSRLPIVGIWGIIGDFGSTDRGDISPRDPIYLQLDPIYERLLRPEMAEVLVRVVADRILLLKAVHDLRGLGLSLNSIEDVARYVGRSSAIEILRGSVRDLETISSLLQSER